MKKRILSSLLAASMIMSASPLTAQALEPTDDAGESPSEITTVESTEPISVPSAQPLTVESVPAVEIEETAETREASDGVVEVDSADALKKAVEDAEDDVETTIRLTQDISDMTTDQMVTIPENKSIILDMDGKKIAVSDDFEGRPFRIEGTLTMVGDGLVDTESAHNAYGVFDNYGSLIVKNGTYRSYTYAGGSVVKNRPESFCEIYSGSFYRQ